MFFSRGEGGSRGGEPKNIFCLTKKFFSTEGAVGEYPKSILCLTKMVFQRKSGREPGGGSQMHFLFDKKCFYGGGSMGWGGHLKQFLVD